MKNEMAPEVRNANDLFDMIIRDQGLKNDAALSRALEVSRPVISKIRSGRAPFSDIMLIVIHESTGMSIRELKAVLRDGLPMKFRVLHPHRNADFHALVSHRDARLPQSASHYAER